MNQKKVIEVKNLCKNYNGIKAVDDISFDVYKQEIFGMVGPNGAGKTTTIECIEGMKMADKGEIKILGRDLSPNLEFKRQIGIQLQEASLPKRIKVKEAISLFSSFYPKPLNYEEILEKMELKDKVNCFYNELSGGQKNKLLFAIALLGNPDILFLDEITLGFDPSARRSVWKLIKEMRSLGKTIFLTTHYMDEAQDLCDRVSIIDKGKIIALDTPQNLISTLNTENKIIFNTDKTFELEIFKDIKSVSRIETNNNEVIIYSKTQSLNDIVNTASQNNITLQNLRVKGPTLEDVYLTLTGKEYEI